MRYQPEPGDDPSLPDLSHPLGGPLPGQGPTISPDFLSRLWDLFIKWWNEPEVYEPQVGDSFPDPGDGGVELPPGGLEGSDDGEGIDEGDGCFIGDTPVLMANGLTKPINGIAIGDQVMARDEKTGISGVGAVAQTFRHLVAETLVLQLEGGEVVETTAAHRFAALKGEFVSAGELRPGDSLSTHSHRGVKVISIGARSTQTTVYNLSVERFQTFFVGNTELWVHNKKKAAPVPDDTP